MAAHNGIEYGLMQAYAEGYELSGREPRITAVDSVMSVTEGHHGAIWLLELLVAALRRTQV